LGSKFIEFFLGEFSGVPGGGIAVLWQPIKVGIWAENTPKENDRKEPSYTMRN